MKIQHPTKENVPGVDRRLFLQGLGACSVAVGGLVLGVPPLHADEEEEGEEKKKKPVRRPRPVVETNIDDFMKIPRAACAIPGPFPGRVVKVTDPASLDKKRFDAAVVRAMIEKGITGLTGKSMKESFGLLFTPEDVVGLKVNPVGAPLINTRLEVTESVIRWLVDSGLPKKNIVIWDRFDESLKEAGYTAANFPGIRIEALQGFKRDEDGHHLSAGRFDKEAFYYAKGVFGATGKEKDKKQDDLYRMQHVFDDEYSYFGKLISKELTKIVNIPAFKNTGNGVSMATKNLAYGALCNVGRLHRPLFFRVCTEVLAAPWIRDKLVLNILDGLRAQYDGGPGMNAQFVYANHSLYFATDPFALDMVGHRELLAKRKEMEVKVSESPRYTDYLHAGEKLGLGIADPGKIKVVEVPA